MFIWGWGGSSTNDYSMQAEEIPNCKLLEAKRLLWGSILTCLSGSCTPLSAHAIVHYLKENLISEGTLFWSDMARMGFTTLYLLHLF